MVGYQDVQAQTYIKYKLLRWRKKTDGGRIKSGTWIEYIE